MARVYSHSVSRAKGSVGMTTYRYVRGRVIQSQKIAPWDPAVDQVGNATRWNERTALLGLISLWCSAHSQSIKNSFNRTKGGSQRNYFMKRNYAALRQALNELAVEYAATKVAPDLVVIEDAIGTYAALHPNTIYRVKKTGYDMAFLTNNWDDADDPAPPTLIDSMTANLDTDYQLTRVILFGSNISQAVKIRLAGALLDGDLVINAGGTRAEFTPATAPVIIGVKELAAMVGSQIKRTIIVAGDQRDYYNLSVLVSPAAGGNVTGAGRYVAGSQVPISAVPAFGYRFIRWSDGNTNSNRTITVNDDITITAEFERVAVTACFSFPEGAVESIQVGAQTEDISDYDPDTTSFEFTVDKGSNYPVVVTMVSGHTLSEMEIQSTGMHFGLVNDEPVYSVDTPSATLYVTVDAASLTNIEITE